MPMVKPFLGTEAALFAALFLEAFLFVMRSFISHNHVLNQAVAHDILLAEEGEVDALNPTKNALRFLETRAGARGQIDLRDITGNDRF